ncbi:MAG: DUF4184 family protein [Candidatus Bathyarchaeota archaeon]
MPLTPLHYPVAYILHKLNRRLSLPGLAIGSMFPDLEIPVIIMLSEPLDLNRLVLHSLLGAVTIGTLLSVFLTVWIYPFFVSSFFKVDKQKVKEKCRLSLGLIFSVFLGNISHVLLDLVNHLENPVFWPFSQFIPSPICLALGLQNASLIAHTVLIVLFVAIFISQRGNLWENLLVGDLEKV